MQRLRRDQRVLLTVGADRTTICHWNNGGSWNAIEVAHSALGAHSAHELDIWPPIEGVTPGHNWPAGQDVFLNGCAVPVEESPPPEPSPSPSNSLPTTGADPAIMAMLSGALILSGVGLSVARRREQRRVKEKPR